MRPGGPVGSSDDAGSVLSVLGYSGGFVGLIFGLLRLLFFL